MLRKTGAESSDEKNVPRRERGLAKRFVALALAEVLCFQSLMGTGVAQAIAEDTSGGVTVTQPADDVAGEKDTEDAGTADEPATPDQAVPDDEVPSADEGEIEGIAGNDEATSFSPSSQAAPSGATEATVPATKTELVTSSNVSQEASFTTLWADNNSGLRPSAAELEAAHEYRAYFMIDGDSEHRYPLTKEDGVTVSDEAEEMLGYTQEALDSLRAHEELVRVRRTKTNEYEATTVDLPGTFYTYEQQVDESGALVWELDHNGQPKLDADGNKIPVYTRTAHSISYAVKHEVDERDYIYPDASGEARYQVSSAQTYPDYVVSYEKECIQLMEDVTFNFKFKVGEDLKNMTIEEWAQRWGTLQTLHVAMRDEASDAWEISGQDWVDLLLRDNNRFTPEFTNDDHTTGTLVAKVPAWHPDGRQLVYSLAQSSEDLDPSEYEDFYQVWYDNSTAPNHGSDTSALFSGGTLNIVHAGTTHFSATKRWMDDDASQRPATTYSLWRYSADKGNYTTATQVRVGAGNVPVEFTVSAEENEAAGDAGIDLGEKVMDLVRANGATLAKYDPDGAPYVYVLREDAPENDYERLLGADVDQETGEVTGDVSPNYYTPDGTATKGQFEGTSRPASDLGVYNQGTIINRRSAQEWVSVTKTWKAGAFQDQLKDVVVDFKLQRILKRHAHKEGNVWVSNHDAMYDEDGNYIGSYEWLDDIDGDSVFDEVSGWYAEKLTQTLSGSYPRYDENGEEWVYRWIEVGVEDPLLGNMGWGDPDTGEFEFPLFLTDAMGEYDIVWFRGAYDQESGTIVNQYVNETDQHVDKWWAALDDEGMPLLDADGNRVYTQDERPNGYDVPSVPVTIFRDGVRYATAEMDGVVDDEAANLVGEDAAGGTVRETAPWHLDLEGLPKYDDEGREYSYLVLEGDVAGYNSRREYDSDQRLTSIYNDPVGEGDTSVAKVSKSWADDGNSTSRVPVTVGVFADRDLLAPDGSVTYGKDALIGTVELSAANGWYGELSIGIAGLSYGDGFYVRELSSEGAYEVLTRDAATGLDDPDIQTGLLSWPAQNRENPWNECMFLESDPFEENEGKFAYQVSYRENTDLGAAEVENRRVGQVWIDLVKTWQDLGAVAAERPSAEFVISCDERTEVFGTDSDGYVYAVLDGDAEPRYVLDNSLNRIKAGDASGVLVENGSLVVPVPSDGSASASVNALPKYDKSGAIVHYSVSERWRGASGDYESVQTGSTEDYTSRWHIQDKLSYTFTNRRSGTKDVTFHMRWFDAYVKEELNQRPDVYLTLYKTVYLYDDNGDPVLDADGNQQYTTELVTGYENYKWRPTAEEGEDALYNEYATIGDLPKYDDHGKEIVYYASAATSASSGSVADLDYQPTWFAYGEADGGHREWDEADSEVSAAADKVLVDSTQTGGDAGYAVREDGTFNFRIASELAADGFKFWRNLPGNFDSADLPDLTIYLQRRLAGGTYAADGSWQATGALAWSDLEVTGSGRDYQVTSVSGPSDVADGKTAVAWASPVEVATNQFEFYLDHYGANVIGDHSQPDQTRLPKYDSNGRRYEYRIQEVVDGLLANGDEGVPGGTTAGSGKPGGSVFVPWYAPNSYSLSNVYNPQKGKLTVKKLFDGRQEGDKFPSVTFKVFRYYVKGDGTKSDAEQVAVKVLSPDGLKTDDAGVTAEGTVTFSDLDIYAPNGQYWVYYVTEAGVDGYASRWAMGDQSLASPADVWGWPDFFANECASSELVTGGLDLTEDGSGFTQPTGTVVADDEDVDVTFKNSYDTEDLISLTGQKRWFDQDDLFGTRPEDVTLRLVRTYQDGTPDAGTGNADGEVTLQSRDPEAQNYLSWEKPEGSDTWVYTIGNVEQYAPDGRPWRYTVSEVLANGGQYSIAPNTSGGTVSAGVGAQLPRISNYLKTKVDVTKVWNDADDPWDQRPDVYVALQLRVDGGKWGAAGDVLAALGITAADGSTLAGLGDKAFEQQLSAENDWSFEWNDIPTEAVVGGVRHALEWRAVETRLVYSPGVEGAEQVIEIASPDDDGSYGQYWPYQPSQSTSLGANGQGDTVFSTTITNTLAQTQIAGTKSWSDEGNRWASRPGTSGADDAWSVTYVLQRSVTPQDASSWSWVTRRGASIEEPLAADGALDANLLTASISGSGDAAQATFEHLPSYDTSGNAYTYRLVELVRGSYAVEGGETLAASWDGRVSLVVAVGAEPAGQTFSNVLKTVGVTGAKLWEDFGSGMVPAFSAKPDVQLELQRSTDGITWTAATLADGKTVPDPAWTQNSALRWTFSYEGLPKTDQAGVAYQYRVREVGNASNGFVDSYGDDGATQPDEAGNVAASTITNTATRFTLDKVGDASTGSEGERLGGVTLKVRGANNGRTYAVWTRDADGNVRSWVNRAGYPEAADALTVTSVANGFVEMVGENAGYVIGLSAGAYIIHESVVPEGHLRAGDATFTLDWSGGIAGLAGAARSEVVAGGEKVTCLTVTDAVLRGNVELYKYYEHDGAEIALSGMTFELWRGTPDADEGNILVAEGITTGAIRKDGAGRLYNWTSGPLWAANAGTAVKTDANGESVLGKYFRTLADGLPEGSYFLRETGESHLTERSEMTIPFTISLRNGVNGSSGQPSYVRYAVENAEFNASVTLEKTDSETGVGVDGATFRLEYKAEGSDSFLTVAAGLETGTSYAGNADGTSFSPDGEAASGQLAISGLKKGEYRLVETSNVGYELDATTAPTAAWTVTDDDQGRTIDLAASGEDGATWSNATMTGGSLANQPRHVTLLMTKTDAASGDALDGVAFRLQRKGADGQFEDVAAAGDLLTGNAYELVVASDGAITGVASAEGAEAGAIVVANVPWGTYRLAESRALPGYASATVGGGVIMTAETTISRESFADAPTSLAIDLGEVSNRQTNLALRKVSADGAHALSGAEFTLSGTFADGLGEKRLVTGADGMAVPATADDVLAGQLLVGQTYVLAETRAPEGYAIPDPAAIRVSVAADGTLELAEDQDAPYFSLSSQDGFTTVTVRDDATVVMVRKVDENGRPLLGATFAMTGRFKGDDDATTRSFSPDGPNAVSVSQELLVAGETYVISEVVVPAGYTKVADATIRMDDDGKGISLVDAPAGWSLAEDGLTLTARDVPAEFTLAKASTDGGALAGATFKVTGLFAVDGEAREETREFVTGEDGRVLVTGIVADGDFAVEEASAPYGFKPSAGTYALHVDEFGRVTEVAASDGFTLSDDTLTVSDEPISLAFAKTDVSGGASLAGAAFEVTGIFADASGHLLNGGEAQTFSNMDVGGLSELHFVQGQTYTLSETRAPAGYELISGVLTFEVTADGTVTLDASGVSNGAYQLLEGDVGIVARDVPIELALVKTDGATPLVGAEFSVTPLVAGDAFADGTSEKVFSTDENGRAELSALLVAGHGYQIRETRAPEGYKQLTGSIVITVNADGTVSAADPRPGVTGGSFAVGDGTGVSDTLTVTDEAVPFLIKKYAVDSSGVLDSARPLAGARFSVTGTFAGEATASTIELVTDENGEAGSELAGRLVVGRVYAISEVEAPAGYVLAQGKLEVIVNADGSLSAIGGAPDEFQVAANGALVVFTGNVTNDPSRLCVVKVAEGDAAKRLFGATFEISPAPGSEFAYEVWDNYLVASTFGRRDLGYAGWAEFERGALRADGKSVYVLRETIAPEGYELNANPLYFKLETNGSVTLLASNDPDDLLAADAAAAMGFAVTGEGNFTVTAEDAPIEVSVAKHGVGEDGNDAPLAGAAFTLSCAESNPENGVWNHFANGSDSDVYELVTDSTGSVAVPSGLLVAGCSYELEETIAPAGHGLTAGILTFTVGEDGTLAKVSGPDAYELANGNEVTITMSDPATRLAIAKVGSDGASGAAMAGAVFEVAPLGDGAFADGSSDSVRLTVGESGLTDELTAKLTYGSMYAVREVAAPDGYQLNEAVVEVGVRLDGSLALLDEESSLAAGWSLGEKDGLFTLTATDEPMPVPKPEEPTTPGTSEGPKSGDAAKPSGAAPFTGDATSSTAVSLLLAGGLALVAAGLRRRRTQR